jgi:TRAP-type C4-dicarboxylate transport system permease small subunit
MPVSTARRGALALLLAVLILFVLGSIEIARGATDVTMIGDDAVPRAWPASALIATGLLLLGGAGLLVIVRRPRG